MIRYLGPVVSMLTLLLIPRSATITGANWHSVRPRFIHGQRTVFGNYNNDVLHLTQLPLQFPGCSEQVQQWERVTYQKLKSLIPTGLTRELKWVDYWKDDQDISYINTAWYNDLIPSHRTTPPSELPP